MSIRTVIFLSLLTVLPLLSDRQSAADERRYVIIHADDAGMSHSVNLATIEAMEKGNRSRFGAPPLTFR